MLPQSNEQQLEKDDAFAFRLEMLKKELDYIDNSIRKFNDIGNCIKKWAISSSKNGDFQERCHSLAALQATWINGSA